MWASRQWEFGARGWYGEHWGRAGQKQFVYLSCALGMSFPLKWKSGVGGE